MRSSDNPSPSRREQRLRVFEADFGRDFGWYVECDGIGVVALSDAHFEDMFWYSYAVEPLGADAAEREKVFTQAFWQRDDLTFRNRVTAEVAPLAFAGGDSPTKGKPRVMVRALSTTLRPTMFERFLLWLRRRKATRRHH